jgi:5,10-methylene-tetrahydrofolate dehydrogenase/Methenyl tetrahydrofolate cyclohydrolase
VSARLIEGRVVARTRLKALRSRIDALPRPPGLVVVRVGEDPASVVYVGKKTERARRLGYFQRQIHLDADITTERLLGVVDELNADDRVDGILVQLPLPPQVDATRVLDRVDPTKDVDGFHPTNAGLLFQGRPRFVPCTAIGVMHLLAHAGAELSGARATVVGRSNIVGRPVAALLEHAGATVTVCHSRTRDLAAEVARAEVLVVAVGKPAVIRGEWVRPGATVIDVGMNRLDDGRLVGDVAFDAAAERAGAITPVPGGVGPLTITMLMENTLMAAEARLGG